MRTTRPERYQILGLKIAYYRKKKGYTQEALAEKIHRSVNLIGQIEGPSTVKGMSLETLFDLADCLEIDPGVLFSMD